MEHTYGVFALDILGQYHNFPPIGFVIQPERESGICHKNSLKPQDV